MKYIRHITSVLVIVLIALRYMRIIEDNSRLFL